MALLDKLNRSPRSRTLDTSPETPTAADSVRAAYRRWAPIYDKAFGTFSVIGRRRAVSTVNALPGERVLEVGVGTGLSLPGYQQDKRITGIDLSPEMLKLARARVARMRLANVVSLAEMDAEATDFEDASFDIAVGMFVASVTPHPRRLLAEMRRVVRPGGHILFVNHFASGNGPASWIERAMARRAGALGWNADFPMAAIFAAEDRLQITHLPPFGFFKLVRIET